MMGAMFPVNSLRNFALVAARTPLVAMIDVDLLLSSSLVQWLKGKDK
jgi:glycosyltransferase-like protein LARGE